MDLERIDQDDIARSEWELVIPASKLTRTLGRNPQLVVVVPMHPVVANHPPIARIGLIRQKQRQRFGKCPRQMPPRIDPSRDGKRLTRLCTKVLEEFALRGGHRESSCNS